MKEETTKTYVQFVGEWEHMSARTSEEEVTSRELADLPEVPDWAIQFSYFDRTTVTLDDDRTFVSEPFNPSPKFHVKRAYQGDRFGPEDYKM